MAHAGVLSGAGFEVTYEGEAPGVQNSTATFSVGGVETFSTSSSLVSGQEVTTPLTAGSNVGWGGASSFQSFTTDFGTDGAIVGTYSGVDIIAADEYGGAGGTGNYAVSFGGSRGQSYDLTFSKPVDYFGYWLSALDSGNTATFYGTSGQVLFQFDAQDVIDTVDALPNSSEYYGNPNQPYSGQDSWEPFVFLNFFDTGQKFTKIVFSETLGGSGYESDNHTVGLYTSMGQGTPVDLRLSGVPDSASPPTASPLGSPSAVPEPATWTMMILGVGLLGAVSRRRRARALAAT